MTTTEFKAVISQFHEHLYQKMPGDLGVMSITEYNGGIRLTFKAKAEEGGIHLICERVVNIPEDRMAAGMGKLVDGLLDLSHYQNSLDPVNGYGLPFTYSGFETEDRWFLDFGSGVKIPAVRHRISESRTSRILFHLKTPWPEWRVAPAYPDKLLGTYGWDTRWAEARAERSARAAYKMMAASWGRLNPHCGKGAVQLPGRFEAAQDWPQSEL